MAVIVKVGPAGAVGVSILTAGAAPSVVFTGNVGYAQTSLAVITIVAPEVAHIVPVAVCEQILVAVIVEVTGGSAFGHLIGNLFPGLAPAGIVHRHSIRINHPVPPTAVDDVGRLILIGIPPTGHVAVKDAITVDIDNGLAVAVPGRKMPLPVPQVLPESPRGAVTVIQVQFSAIIRSQSEVVQQTVVIIVAQRSVAAVGPGKRAGLGEGAISLVQPDRAAVSHVGITVVVQVTPLAPGAAVGYPIPKRVELGRNRTAVFVNRSTLGGVRALIARIDHAIEVGIGTAALVDDRAGRSAGTEVIDIQHAILVFVGQHGHGDVYIGIGR